MGEKLDDFLTGLQNEIFDEARKAYGEIGFQRWRKPLYRGKMTDADGYGRLTGPCGDTMEIFLQFGGDRVKSATFFTDGCGASTVCGSLAAELAIGKTADELEDITGEDILSMLGFFPKEDQHCAFLAAETVQEALGEYLKKQLRITSETKAI